MWAVGGADAKRLREERLARAGAAQAKALAIGLPWPQAGTMRWEGPLARGAGTAYWTHVGRCGCQTMRARSLQRGGGAAYGLSPPVAPVKLGSMSMPIQNQDTSRWGTKKVILEPRLKYLVPLFRGVAAGATRLGHAKVACGGEEALPVLLGDPQGHTAALAGNTVGAQCSGQASRPVEVTDHIVDGRGREGHCACALVLVRHLRRHGSGARQNCCGLAAVDTLGADLSVEAGAVVQACRRVLAERARSRCEARSTTELTTESAMDTAQVRYRGRTRHQRRRNFATYDSGKRDWLVREGREDETGAGQ